MITVILSMNMILLTGRLEIISNRKHDRGSFCVKRIEVRNKYFLIELGSLGRSCEESIGLSR